MKFRPYQEKIIKQGFDIVKEHGFLYLSMEVRTGKTLTSLGIAQNVGAKSLLFVTKKKAISSIESDYKLLNPDFDIEVINYESIHKIPSKSYDFFILDEAHCMSKLGKPSKRAKDVKSLLVKHSPNVILMSGTPTPESYSQMYHQVYGIPNNPFSKYKNFYRFADDYINVKTRLINGFMSNDYSDGLPSIIEAMKPYSISYTQKEAGFSSEIEETVLNVRLEDSTYKIAKKLIKDLVVEGDDEVILADTAVKLKQKLHQIFSGTVKFESGNSMVLDYSKAEFIKEKFKGYRIGVFYKFKEELNALKEVFKDNLCTDLNEFDNGCEVIALQIVSGREGISLKSADYLIFYNIDFSATSYWQARDRMTTKDRLKNNVFWIFSEGGIEHDIYKQVIKKKDYTIRHFKKNYNIK